MSMPIDLKHIFLMESVNEDSNIPETIRKNPRYMEQYKLLMARVGQGSIPNVEYKDINFQLSNAAEKDFNPDHEMLLKIPRENRSDDWNDLYYAPRISLHALISYKKKVDIIAKKNLHGDLKEFIQNTQERLQKWMPIADAYKFLKDKVVKRGQEIEKKNQEKEERYRAIVDLSKTTGVSDILNQVVKDSYEETLREYIDWMTQSIEKLLNKKESRNPELWIKDKFLRFLFGKVVYDKNKSNNQYSLHHEYDFELRENASDIIEKMSKEQVDAMKDSFVYKNTMKLTNIISKKQIISHDVLHVGSNFMATIRFKFADGTQFSVRNKTVLKWSTKGTPFYQFPTTFHDVNLIDGSFRKMMSEQEMNEEWL